MVIMGKEEISEAAEVGEMVTQTEVQCSHAGKLPIKMTGFSVMPFQARTR